MKKLLLFMTLFFLSAISIQADEQHKVKLYDSHSKEQVKLGYCNVFVTMVGSDDDGNAKVTVEIENLDESNVIILFGHAYPEKELKKLSPSITFDKTYPGTKGHRDIDTYKEVRNVILIDPSEKYTLPEILFQNKEIQSCRLPLYIAKYKGKKILKGSNGRNKILLMEKQILELEIEVEVMPDEDFIRLEKECNDLMDEINKPTFCLCVNSKHKPSLQRQKALYNEKISKIKKEIADIKEARGWFGQSGLYQKYTVILQKLDAIDLSVYERDCGKHRNTITSRSRHSCKYCNLSLQQIYHKLDDYYKKVYNSSNRKATKDAVIADVNMLYRCCTDVNCTTHASSWRNSEYKSRITDRYNRISNF